MIRDVFNWLAQKPSTQFTLVGDENSFKMNRAGRFVERVVSIPPMFFGAVAMLTAVPAALFAPPVGAMLFAGGALTMAFGKAAGLIKGGLTHIIAHGASSLADYIAGPKEAGAPQPKPAAAAPQP